MYTEDLYGQMEGLYVENRIGSIYTYSYTHLSGVCVHIRHVLGSALSVHKGLMWSKGRATWWEMVQYNHTYSYACFSSVCVHMRHILGSA